MLSLEAPSSPIQKAYIIIHKISNCYAKIVPESIPEDLMSRDSDIIYALDIRLSKTKNAAYSILLEGVISIIIQGYIPFSSWILLEECNNIETIDLRSLTFPDTLGIKRILHTDLMYVVPSGIAEMRYFPIYKTGNAEITTYRLNKEEDDLYLSKGDDIKYILYIELTRPPIKEDGYVTPSLYLIGVLYLQTNEYISFHSWTLKKKFYNIDKIDLRCLTFPDSLCIKKLLHTSYTMYSIPNGIITNVAKMEALSDDSLCIIMTWACIPDKEVISVLLHRIMPMHSSINRQILEKVIKDLFTESVPNSLDILLEIRSIISPKLFDSISVSIYKKFKVLRYPCLYGISPKSAMSKDLLCFHFENGAARYEEVASIRMQAREFII